VTLTKAHYIYDGGKELREEILRKRCKKNLRGNNGEGRRLDRI
jgi:hypothetical protein